MDSTGLHEFLDDLEKISVIKSLILFLFHLIKQHGQQ